jgi:hypothetical protein
MLAQRPTGEANKHTDGPNNASHDSGQCGFCRDVVTTSRAVDVVAGRLTNDPYHDLGNQRNCQTSNSQQQPRADSNEENRPTNRHKMILSDHAPSLATLRY